jgi:hypothetical protein
MSGSSGTAGIRCCSYSRGLMISQVEVGGRSSAPLKAAFCPWSIQMSCSKLSPSR